MSKITRRNFLKVSGASMAAASVAAYTPFAIGGASKKVVVVGGGMGGATAAKYIRLMDPSVEVTLIEPKKTYHTGFMSNEVISGERTLDSIGFTYDGLKAHGV
ncbi:MAG TPA: cytochrome C, partial [Gammaproteobacteria bacterium]|nr:cytochrome C [Gammaproteobacteria bacterium]